MSAGKAQKVSNAILSGMAGVASFLFTLWAFLTLTSLDSQLLASIFAGAFCLMVVYIASERPNSGGARAMAALADRLLAVEDGDLTSPAPAKLYAHHPKLASAVDRLFEEVRASIENAQALGMYDPVTSLPNRLHFRSEADKMLCEAEGCQSAMMFVDLDRFKAVNDCLGHARGDQLLIMVANRLRVTVAAAIGEADRPRPLLARLAGDEFTLFFPEIDSVESVEMIARRIALAIAEPFELNGNNIDIGASIGVAISPDHGDSIERLMRSADLAMYRAKSRGGGQHCLFSEHLANEYRLRVETELALTDVVERGQLRLVLQPQMSLTTGEAVGVEALVRWEHPEDGTRLPSTFLTVAEQTGMIGMIGDWVIQHSAEILSSWIQKGHRRRLSFNVSPRQIDRVEFFSRLRQIFANHDVPLSMIEIELSEGAMMQCSAAELAEMAALRSEGVSIALDDFGTGYSNIARLRTLPVDRVKIDQMLTADIETSEEARNMVQAVVHMIKAVGCEIVAESVENAAQADLLRAMGCDTVQGYVFAGPMSESDYEAWIARFEGEQRSVA